MQIFPTIPCRATIVPHDMLDSMRCLLFCVELQQFYRKCYIGSTLPSIRLYKRCYIMCTFSLILCRATTAQQEMPHNLYLSCYSLQSHRSSAGDATQRKTFPTIPCRTTIAPQEMLHSVYVSYYFVQSYSSSTGDVTLYMRFLPIEALQEMLQSLCNSYYSLESYSTSTGNTTHSTQYSLQSYNSSTGDASQ